MFQQTLTQVTTLFLFILVGYVLSKKKLLPENAAQCFSIFLVWAASPALYLNTFTNQFTPDKLREASTLILISLGILALMYLVSMLVKRFITKDPYSQGVFTYSMCVPNFGYMGNVLVLALMGEAVLLRFQLFIIPISVFSLTKGYAMLLERKSSLRALLNPMIVGMACGMVLGLAGIRIPGFIAGVLTSASDCIGPMAMLLTGCVIAKFNLKEILNQKEIYFTVALKMIVLPLAVLVLGKLLNIPSEYLFLIMMVAALPTGLNSVVFPSTIGKDCSFAAGLAVVSNVVALITVPLFLGQVA